MGNIINGNPYVSIIIPIYNSEPYLKNCIDSILHQEYTDFELILVDDGSEDSSGKICDEYADADARVRTIHKENSGVSDARNLAISEANGTWIQFADSDDWITPDATKLFVKAAEDTNCDMVISDFYRVVGERFSRKGDIDRDGLLTREEFAACMMENPADFYYGVLWNKFYRRDLIRKFGLRMDSSVSWCEDFLFNMEYILHAGSVYVLQEPTYYYRKRKGSLAGQGMSIPKTIHMKMMVFECYNDFYKNIFDEKDYRKKRRQIYRFLLDAAGDSTVAPAIHPGTQKLRDSYSPISPDQAAGDGILAELYRSRRILERYLESMAQRYALTMNDVILFLYLSQVYDSCTRKEMSAFTGMSPGTVSRSLQKLSAREYIAITEIWMKEKQKSRGNNKKGEKKLHIELLPACEDILSDISAVQNDIDAARFDGFTEEERASCEKYLVRIKDNTLKVIDNPAEYSEV